MNPESERQADGAELTPVEEQTEPATLSYASVPTPFKTIRRLPAFEANLAAAKLQDAGINCYVDGQNIAIAHPLLFGQVALQVSESDVERAEQVLAAVRTSPDVGDYVDETYRCPNCRGKAVDLLPLSPRLRKARLGCVGVLLLPILIGVGAWVLHVEQPALDRPLLVLGWMVVIAVLAYVLLTAERGKRCRDCGHEWGRDARA